ncbi:potassium channel subfamily K member 12 isoform X2 [Lepisosteus oculatus]|uniref:potassium channel subfamily K member 12 isoform X2 n=1 Tax=Lepisosteus oculatus TaxID=7918 RepID=UPI0035F507B8
MMPSQRMQGCRSLLHINEDNGRFLLLALLISLYLLCGAAVFSAIERPSELEAQSLWNRTFFNFSDTFNISLQDLSSFLRDYEAAIAAGIRADSLRPRWDFTGAFYFVGTVVSTIGFGMTTPATVAGKVFLIFYGLLGCAGTILFFNLFLERIITLLAVIMKAFHERQLRRSGLLPPTIRRGSAFSDSGSLAGWKPSVYYVMMILGLSAIILSCCASAMYTPVEGWNYIDSLYYCFVTFSTIGFGDLVSSQNAAYENQGAELDAKENGLPVLPPLSQDQRLPGPPQRHHAGLAAAPGTPPLGNGGDVRQRHRGPPAVWGDDLHEGPHSLQQGLPGDHAEAALGDGQWLPADRMRQLAAQWLLRRGGRPGHHEQPAGGDQRHPVEPTARAAPALTACCLGSVLR